MAHEALDMMIENAKRDHESAKRQLLSDARAMQRRMERLVKTVEDGFTVNELGEVQGSGLALDRLCGEFVRTAQQVTKLEWLADQLG